MKKYERFESGTCPKHGSPTPVYLYDRKKDGGVTQICLKCRNARRRTPQAATLGDVVERLERATLRLTAMSDLRDAVRDLYYSAHWTPDRPVDAEALWTRVRDAAGFTPGGTATLREEQP